MDNTPNDNQYRHLLTLRETAQFLRVNIKTVRKYIKEDRLECLRVSPKKIYVSWAQLNKFLRSCLAEYEKEDLKKELDRITKNCKRKKDDR
ncbi:hypothetical protein LNTAR_05061 [Lentisphaera araneosa HTCC2155]|uniref:Helix-turn-helix domain-containing protein n=1 Tax=Lentisphaera araneosa HTCC2155 TaxID=313628 RepID=A6DLJ9_9BACT|nr:helix-turn-helix domain-containing protein [Lentisphaera araneosa]EDM27454.1 hypothetical protein LNTAR_05061 [Lentisphaera araneosa HTCC2155]